LEDARIKEAQHSGKESKIKNVAPALHCLLSRPHPLHVHRFTRTYTAQTETKPPRWVSKPVFIPPKLTNMQLQAGSIYIAKVGPFLIGGGTLEQAQELFMNLIIMDLYIHMRKMVYFIMYLIP
jgi:hypothetical protein